MSEASWLVMMQFPKTEMDIKAFLVETKAKLAVVHLIPSWERRHLVSPRARESVAMGWVHMIKPVNLIVHKAP